MPAGGDAAGAGVRPGVEGGWSGPYAARRYTPPGAACPVDGDGLRALAFAGELPPDPVVTYLAAHWPEHLPRDPEPVAAPAPAATPDRVGPWGCSWIDGVKLTRTILVF